MVRDTRWYDGWVGLLPLVCHNWLLYSSLDKCRNDRADKHGLCYQISLVVLVKCDGGFDVLRQSYDFGYGFGGLVDLAQIQGDSEKLHRRDDIPVPECGSTKPPSGLH
jgi:hypothetical protein